MNRALNLVLASGREDKGRPLLGGSGEGADLFSRGAVGAQGYELLSLSERAVRAQSSGSDSALAGGGNRSNGRAVDRDRRGADRS